MAARRCVGDLEPLAGACEACGERFNSLLARSLEIETMQEPPNSNQPPTLEGGDRLRAGADVEAAARKSEDRVMIGCVYLPLALLALVVGGCWVFLSTMHWTKGRPLRGRARRRLPRATSDVELEYLQAAALHWRNMAAEEYESIASFSELALDLMAVGAPVALVERCHRAALDESRHTEMCLTVARSLEVKGDEQGAGPHAKEGGPSALRARDEEAREASQARVTHALKKVRRRPRWRTALLTRLAVEGYLDGCIGEGSSARVLAELSMVAGDARLRKTLEVLGREESEHARLGADIVAWCRMEGGPVVERALALARRRANLDIASSSTERDLRRYGVPDSELRAAAVAQARG